jgi:hypothetical protein
LLIPCKPFQLVLILVGHGKFSSHKALGNYSSRIEVNYKCLYGRLINHPQNWIKREKKPLEITRKQD